MRAKQPHVQIFNFAHLCPRTATHFPFRTKRFLSRGDTFFHTLASKTMLAFILRQMLIATAGALCRQHCHQRQHQCRRHQRYILILQEQTSRRLLPSLAQKELVRRMRSHDGVFVD
jgi:hypothetical protein